MKVNGIALRVIREGKRLSYGNLSRSCGIDKSFLHGLETGKKPGAKPETVQAIADALEVPVEAILSSP